MLKKNKPAALLILLTLFANTIFAGDSINSDSIFFYVYNQQYDRAELELHKLKNSIKPSTYFIFETDLKWWETLSFNRKEEFEMFEEYLNERLSASKTETNSIEGNLQELVCLNYLLRLMAATNQHLKMINIFFKLNSCIDSFELTALSNDEKDIYIIYKAVFNISKNKILLINKTNNTKNIQVLKGFENSENIVNKTFAHYFLAKIYAELEKNPEEAQKRFKELYALYPNNQFFRTEATLFKGFEN